MRNSKTLARIRQNQLVKMCCLGHYIPAFIKQAAHFGFDCIWLDMEHRNFSDRDVQALLATSANGIPNSDWFVTSTGDGFETQVDPTNPDIIYAQSQYGGLVRFNRKTGNRVKITLPNC